MIVYGTHAAFEALRAGRATRLSLVARPGAAPAPNRRTAACREASADGGGRTISETWPRACRRAATPGGDAGVQAPADWTPADSWRGGERRRAG